MENEFSKLPDCMSVKDLEEYFDKFIKIYKGENDVISSLDALDELADRQWNTYELLSGHIKEQICEYLKDVIDYQCYEVMDWILIIIIKLGLTNVYNLILKEYNNEASRDVKNVIEEVKLEYGYRISDPYYGMR